MWRGGLANGLVAALVTGLVVAAGAGGVVAQNVDPAAGVVLLGAGDTEGEVFARGVLLREQVRQALLLAAREELRLGTRDLALREFDAGKQPAVTIRVKVDGNEARIELFRPGAGDAARPGELAWSGVMALPFSEGAECVRQDALAEVCEGWSRREFVEALKALGYQARAAPQQGAAAELPDGLGSKVGDLNLVWTFDALRRAHGVARSGGESRAALGVLARGYADLAALTEQHWNASSKVFFARAMLYAQRLVVRNPDSASALWQRAYVRTLAGLHGAALADLGRAAKVHDAAKDGGPPPGWVRAIELHCKYDVAGLQALAGSDRALARLATFLAFLNVTGLDKGAELLEKGRSALAANEENYHVMDRLTVVADLGANDQLTATAPVTLIGKTLVEGLPSVSGLPEEAARKVAALRGRAGAAEAAANPAAGNPAGANRAGGEGRDGIARVAAVWKALVAEGAAGKDAGEPSWSALGRLIEDVHFLQTYRRAWFLRDKWSIDIESCAQYVGLTIELLGEDHPFRSFIEHFGVNRRRDPARYDALLAEVRVVDPAWPVREWRGWALGTKPRAETAWNAQSKRLFESRDAISRDLERSIPAYRDGQVNTAEILLKVSPHSPFAIATLVTRQWEQYKDKAREYEGWAPGMAVHLGALGTKYLEEKRTEDARRCFDAYLKLARDKWVYQALAEEHLKSGDEAKWVEWLEAYLKDSPDEGLSHARLRADMARELMERGRFEKALPYAEAAAQTWASWAMHGAADCHERLGNWDEAVTWRGRIAERYPNDAIQYFAWCWRTGKGDLQAADRLAQASIARTGSGDRMGVAIYHYLKGDKASALRWYRQSVTAIGVTAILMHVALGGDELGDKNLRDQALARLAGRTSREPDQQYLPELAKLMQQALSKGEKDTLDLEAVDWLIERQNRSGKLAIREMVGRFLLLHGDRQRAIVYLTDAVRSTDAAKWHYVFAWKALKEQGLDPEKLRREKAAAP
jgi:tetratricopeptide (TPR) repeat protein